MQKMNNYASIKQFEVFNEIKDIILGLFGELPSI